MELSNAQRTAIESVGAPLLVTAGPGSGKTAALAQRVARLFEGGADPFQMLIISFSNKTVRELRERIETLVPAEAVAQMSIVTFHKLGLLMLRQHGDLPPLSFKRDAQNRSPRVFGPDMARGTLKKAIGHAAHQSSQQDKAAAANQLERLGLNDLANHISLSKWDAVPPEVFAATACDPVRLAVSAAYCEYQRLLHADNAVDLDDLIFASLRLLAENEEARGFYQDRWSHILVDELQDASLSQFKLMVCLADKHRNLYATGDHRQSVYGFRGGLGEQAFVLFRQTFADCAEVMLPDNYRSQGRIVYVANALIQDVSSVQTARKPAEALNVLIRAASEFDEARRIGALIQSALTTGAFALRDIAVLIRTHEQTAPIEHELMALQLPYTVMGRGHFFDHREVREIIAYLALSQDALGDPYSLTRILNVPERGFDAKLVAALRGDEPELTAEMLLDGERVRERGGLMGEAVVKSLFDALSLLERRCDRPPLDLIRLILADDGLRYRAHLCQDADKTQTRLARIAELERFAAKFASVPVLLEEIELLSGEDPLADTQDQVTLLTLHEAKGLEWPMVIIAGVEEGLIPHQRAQISSSALKQERQLLFVGMTRPSNLLCLTYARTRRGQPSQSSRFLAGLPRELFTTKWEWSA